MAQATKPSANAAASPTKATQVSPPPQFVSRLPQPGKTLVLPKGKPVTVTGMTLKGGGAVKEDSVVTLTWDDKGLDAVFDNTDSAIASEFATTRDSVKFWKDDSVELLLDIGHRHDTRTPATQPIEIALSVAGGLLDAKGRDVGFNIEGIESTVARTEKGWRASIHIPWKGLGAEPKVNEVWGLNLGRIDHEGKADANPKHMSWSPYSGADFKEVNEWGHVVFAPADATPESEGVKAAVEAIRKRHDDVIAATIFPQTEKTLALPQGEAVKATGFVNMNTDAPELQPTSATMKWTPEAIEFVFDCTDGAIAAAYSEHDAIKMWKDDCVVVWLDPGHTHNTEGKFLQIMCSATGAVHDIRNGDPKFDIEGLKSAVVRTDKGWQATIKIPWQGLGVEPPKPGEAWGFNMSRIDQPGVWDYTKTDLTTWAPGAKDGQIDRWGHLVFVAAKAGADDPALKQARLAIDKMHESRRQAILASQAN
ncbi:MAG: hypothetical protein NTW19_12655 [Planctomycetota bacterium]|nr:hypothetical protein [Planctomycetota bacterium]